MGELANLIDMTVHSYLGKIFGKDWGNLRFSWQEYARYARVVYDSMEYVYYPVRYSSFVNWFIDVYRICMDLHGFHLNLSWSKFDTFDGQAVRRFQESALFLGHLEAWVWRTRRSCLGLGMPGMTSDSIWLMFKSFDLQRILTYFHFLSHFFT